MTRFCMRRDQIIGEKCAQCGTEVTVSSNGHAVTGADFDCPSCGHHFLQGDGGETGGMCEPCFDVELQKAHDQAANPQCTQAGRTVVSEQAQPGPSRRARRRGPEGTL